MFYICPVCGNVIYVMNGDINRVKCCGKEMIKLESYDKDASLEKHVPYCKINGDMVDVSVGEVLHPMDNDHYIMWIAYVCGNSVNIVHLNPNDEPKATFLYESGASVYAYCNKHGLWKKEI